MRGKRLHLPTAVAATPDLAISAVFLCAWTVPSIFGTRVIGDLVSIMVLEFFVIHSSFFMAGVIHGASPPRKKAGGVLLLGLFYSAILAAVIFAFGKWLMLAGFWILIINRLLESLRKDRSGEVNEMRLTVIAWIANAFFYIMSVTITSILPIPGFGETVSIDAGYTSGMWVEEPHKAMAAGFLYFGASGLFHFRIRKWVYLLNQTDAK